MRTKSVNGRTAALAGGVVVSLTILAISGAHRPASAAGALGDANCDGSINAIDAALVLQYSAGLIRAMPCERNAGETASGYTNPAAGLDFSISIDGESCTTSTGPAKCTLDGGQVFTLTVCLNRLPSKAPGYEGVDIKLDYSGVTSHDNGDIETYWAECTFPASGYDPAAGLAAFGCATFGDTSTHTGVIGKIDFTCSASGAMILRGSRTGDTGITAGTFSYLEGHDETLTVNCGAPTDTPEPVYTPAPTNAPRPTYTPAPTYTPRPTYTPQPTNTLVPTNSPVLPTATPTPTPEPLLLGDVNCDGSVNSIDASLILQYAAGIIGSLPCDKAPTPTASAPTKTPSVSVPTPAATATPQQSCTQKGRTTSLLPSP